MLGLVWALREFRPYLYGQRFLVRTDHSCLRWLTTFKEPEGQVARWLENLAELDFEVEHRAGRLHGNADALSRTSCTQCGRLVKRQRMRSPGCPTPNRRLAGRPAGGPKDPTTAAMVGWRELAGGMSPGVYPRHARAVATTAQLGG
ncbi:transposon Ty3-I Gag-Pol poly protein [Trichinella spiralis]|uniref:transposon Ty3-I Gag-Pol poly protein n=1 Tax=Trichinella spiralis TaxID=6334 RepID=UPI0001EFE81F|nr:transposon Ty3-I Gag-Pol poly protein [Trichinella spiralis]